MNTKNIISWALRITVAIILIQTLYFKFTAHPDSVYIFSLLGLEPWGRIALGIIELITALLILRSNTKIIGMATGLGIIIGAVFSHILVLGINVSNDGGGLFTLAIIVFIASSIFLLMHKNELISLIQKFIKK
ncbi:MAG: DoxX family protein [Cytophagales bacterium]|nr:MAG: DoxX family protein [Cytophagales bacterium]